MEAVDSKGDTIRKSEPFCTISVEETGPDILKSGCICSMDEGFEKSVQGNSGTNVLLFSLGFASCALGIGAARLFDGVKKCMGWERAQHVQYEAIPLDDYE